MDPIVDNDDDNTIALSLGGLYSSGSEVDYEAKDSDENSDKTKKESDTLMNGNLSNCTEVSLISNLNDPGHILREFQTLKIEELPVMKLTVTYYHNQTPNISTRNIRYMAYPDTLRFFLVQGNCFARDHLGLWKMEDIHSDYQWYRATYCPLNKKRKKRLVTIEDDLIIPKPCIVRYLRAFLPVGAHDLIPRILQASFPMTSDRCASCRIPGLEVKSYRCRQCKQWWCWQCKLDLSVSKSPGRQKGYYLKCTEHIHNQLP
jgi:hypothetical protein